MKGAAVPRLQIIRNSISLLAVSFKHPLPAQKNPPFPEEKGPSLRQYRAMGGGRLGGPSGMAASTAYPRPTRERARSVLAARRLYFCTALSLAREPNNSVASHVGPGLLASPPSGHVCAQNLLPFRGWKMRGAVLRMSTSVWCARCHACDSGR